MRRFLTIALSLFFSSPLWAQYEDCADCRAQALIAPNAFIEKGINFKDIVCHKNKIKSLADTEKSLGVFAKVGLHNQLQDYNPYTRIKTGMSLLILDDGHYVLGVIRYHNCYHNNPGNLSDNSVESQGPVDKKILTGTWQKASEGPALDLHGVGKATLISLSTGRYDDRRRPGMEIQFNSNAVDEEHQRKSIRFEVTSDYRARGLFEQSGQIKVPGGFSGEGFTGSPCDDKTTLEAGIAAVKTSLFIDPSEKVEIIVHTDGLMPERATDPF